MSRDGARNSTRLPESWVGGENRWTREENRAWRDFLLDPKGGDPDKPSLRRGAVSHGARPESVDELYERMVARGIVRDTPEEAYRDLIITGTGILRVRRPAKKKKRGRK